MQRFTFENQGTNTNLVYEISATDVLDTMSLGMLTNNDIPGLAKTTFTQMDMTKFIKYNVSAKVSATQLFSGSVNKKRLLGVFNGVINAMLSAEEYMLDMGSLLLDLDYIFADVSNCDTVMLCLPLMNEAQKNPDLGAFFKNIVFNTQFDQSEDCAYVAQILNYLNSNPVLAPMGFKNLLEQLAQPAKPQAQQMPVQQAPVQQAPIQQAPIQQMPMQQAPAQQPVYAQQQPPMQSQKAPVPQAAPQPRPMQKPAQPPMQKPAQPPMQKPAQPPMQNAPAMNMPNAQQQASEEKPMSMFYLLQHYNKENAAAYKAQQEAKKNNKSATAKPAAPAAPAGFAMPGQQPAPQQAPVGFAAPGQRPPMPGQPAPGFAVPGQKPPMPGQPAPGFAMPGQPAAPAPKPAAQPAAPQPMPQPAPKPMYQPQPPVSGGHISFGETSVLGGGSMVGETSVLGVASVDEPARINPHLIRIKNNENIPLNKPVYRIGKERSYVDYFIGDNTAISRSHANIVNHNGEFFIVDTNSTNHTYVEGRMIPSNEETKLEDGTKFRLANEDFEFKLY